MVAPSLSLHDLKRESSTPPAGMLLPSTTAKHTD
jgi:hypothetical protein